jgi:hypothetical protein
LTTQEVVKEEVKQGVKEVNGRYMKKYRYVIIYVRLHLVIIAPEPRVWLMTYSRSCSIYNYRITHNIWGVHKKADPLKPCLGYPSRNGGLRTGMRIGRRSQHPGAGSP